MTIRKEIAEAIVEYCKRGFTATDAAVKYNVSVPTVYQVCGEAGVVFQNKRVNDRREIANWVKANKATAQQAMNHFKCSLPTLKKACLENRVALKVALKVKKNPPAVGAMRVLSYLLDSKKTSAEIAESLGISRQYVEEVKVSAIHAKILGPRSLFTVKRKNANKA